MPTNIYKDYMQKAYLFGAPVLYSEQPIPREDIPQGWYCYDLRGTAEDPSRPYSLVDQAEKNHAGSVLSYLPLKNGRSQSRLVKDMFQLSAVSVTLNKFCSDEKISRPEVPVRHLMRPASPEEAGLFFAQMPERDAVGSPARAQRSGSGGERKKERSGWSFRRQAETEQSGVSSDAGAIGHVRMDFGSGGREFHHSWWPRGPEELNTQEFRDELDKVVNDLRKGVLKDLRSMRRHCHGDEGAIAGGSCCQNYGFTLETEKYIYRLRCNPTEGDYQAYLSCFDKQAQILSEKPVIGRIIYANGEPEDFTDPQKYLQTVREELPYQATTGFRCETLTDDPAVRKAVDDMLCDLYGEENPKQLEDYSMTMGGM